MSQITRKLVLDPKAKTGMVLRGGAEELFKCRAHQVVLAGPAETGKTIGSCVKLHAVCMKYPGSQHSMIRKTFASIAGSVGMTWARVTKGAGIEVIGGEKPTKYVYPNGSVVWVGGMDKPDRVLSSERDTIYVNQAEELTLKDWEYIATRCTGRGAIVKHPQLHADANPGGSKHWIKQKAMAGTLTLLVSRHQDNPTLYDENGNITEQGKRSLAILSGLTGIRRKRLFEGLWATAEGAVYDTFDGTPGGLHVIHREPAEMKRWFLAMDVGFTNPAVILLIGADEDNRWHIFREFYQTGVLPKMQVEEAKAYFRNPRAVAATPNYDTKDNAGEPVQIYRPVAKLFENNPEISFAELAAVDAAAAGLIAELNDAGVAARGAKGGILDGIARIQNRLAAQADGRSRLTVEPCCFNTINEFESYVWKPEKDIPVKEFDHVLDSLRYLADALAEPTGAWDSAAVAAAMTAQQAASEPASLPGSPEPELDWTDLPMDDL